MGSDSEEEEILDDAKQRAAYKKEQDRNKYNQDLQMKHGVDAALKPLTREEKAKLKADEEQRLKEEEEEEAKVAAAEQKKADLRAGLGK